MVEFSCDGKSMLSVRSSQQTVSEKSDLSFYRELLVWLVSAAFLISRLSLPLKQTGLFGDKTFCDAALKKQLVIQNVLSNSDRHGYKDCQRGQPNS